MEPYEYRTMFEFESTYWRHRGIRAILLGAMKELGLGASARILAAGCGTGKNVEVIEKCVTPHCFGFDLSPHAPPFWPSYGLTRVCRASVNEIPFRDESFDAVLSIDVLECEEVRVERAYGELWRVTRPGGFIILVVPGHLWLTSEAHDRSQHACRRYNRRLLRALLESAPVRVIRLTHLFPTLFPLIAGYRLLKRLSPPRADESPRSELTPLRPVVNELLFRLVEAERLMLSRLDFPFGSSMLAIARKNN